MSIIEPRNANQGNRTDGHHLLREAVCEEGAATSSRRTLAVMESLPMIRPTTNPYLVQLIHSLESTPGIDVSFLDWRRAILGPLDVFHVHWPELLVGSHHRLGRVARRLLTIAFLIRIRLTRVAVVRTLHNLERPSGLARIDLLLLGILDRLTTLTITLNDQTPLPEGQPRRTILHGHYRDWYARHRAPEAIKGRVGYVGLIRRYKGVGQLIRAFHAMDDPESTLSVAGRPSSEELENGLLDLAGHDPRIEFHFQFLEDAELVSRICESELIVLPYKHMHNSGTVLAALSLARPVLVPDNAVNRALAEEVGPGWIHFFDHKLTRDDLVRALGAIANRDGRIPDLSRRDWSQVGGEHAEAFRTAVALRRVRQ
ncbi:glycosyltransferase [Microbacterium sp.]|uniref:glycosyltransferase n=1 Tax=Microbacterium sp. TaxID=51671 RepID=UPI003A8E8A41